MTSSVEALVLERLIGGEGGQGWRGGHIENALALHLFAILVLADSSLTCPACWSSPSDRPKLQACPLELALPSFYQNIGEKLEEKLSRITNEEAFLSNEVTECWEASRGIWLRGLDRERWSLEETLDLARCVGGTVVSGMLRLLAQDYHGWSGGMPDLFLWKPNGLHGEEETARWVEVKGPGDSLRTSQRAWLDRLATWGATAEVIYVSESSPN